MIYCKAFNTLDFMVPCIFFGQPTSKTVFCQLNWGDNCYLQMMFIIYGELVAQRELSAGRSPSILRTSCLAWPKVSTLYWEGIEVSPMVVKQSKGSHRLKIKGKGEKTCRFTFSKYAWFWRQSCWWSVTFMLEWKRNSGSEQMPGILVLECETRKLQDV